MEKLKINSPIELSNFMKENINYGYVNKYNKSICNSQEDMIIQNHAENYFLLSPDEVLQYKVGSCWDQTEFERKWFNNHKIENYAIFCTFATNKKTSWEVVDGFGWSYSIHSFLIYKQNNKWHWFENSWDIMSGIYSFDSLTKLLEDFSNKQIKSIEAFHGFRYELDKKKLKFFLIPKMNSGISHKEYIKNATKTELKLNDMGEIII